MEQWLGHDETIESLDAEADRDGRHAISPAPQLAHLGHQIYFSRAQQHAAKRTENNTQAK